MKEVKITLCNIDKYLGDLALDIELFPTNIWDVFDERSYRLRDHTDIISLSLVICTKNQLTDPRFLSGEKRDPRQTAYNRMLDASKGLIDKRDPITVAMNKDGTCSIIDGNATSQVLMIMGWKNIPIQIVDP